MLVDERLFYIHIPRTGGRHVSQLLTENYPCKYHDYEEFIYKASTNKLTNVPHLDFPYYETLFNFGSMKKFTVVRDPVERFISTFSCGDYSEEEVDNYFKSQENFNTFVNKSIVEAEQNWFVPQINFIGNDVDLWKYEDKFEKEFYAWLEKKFNIIIKKTDGKYEKGEYDSFKKIEIDDKQKNFIKNYYYKDYIILNYA